MKTKAKETPAQKPTLMTGRILDESPYLAYSLPTIMAGAFMPYSFYNPELKEYELKTKKSIWSRLQYTLLDSPVFGAYWGDQRFRYTIEFVNYIVEVLSYPFYSGTKSEFSKLNRKEKIFVDAAESAGDYCVSGNQDTHEGTILLREAITKLYDMPSTDICELETDEIDDLLLSVSLMIQLQAICIASEVKARDN